MMKKKAKTLLIRTKASVLACVVVATVMGASSALAANGQAFILGQNNGATLPSYLTATVAGSSPLVITNPSTAANSTALDLRVSGSNTPPMRVNSSARVTNLNADKLDGKDSTELAGPRGYAHVSYDSNGNPVFDPARSRGVNGVKKALGSAPGAYCFDLTFTPKVAVGSPFANNSAVVATSTPPDEPTISCEAGYQDAAARIFASNTGTPVTDVKFKIMFE